MHADEIATNVSLVRRLLTAQFPEWADLPLTPVPSAGTDNALYRLGDEMVVRLPRIYWARGQVEKEQDWLPKLAPHLPLAIPVPLAMGEPTLEYPWHWSVYQWLEGKNVIAEPLADPHQAAIDLAQFIAALQKMDATHGPPPGEHNSGRGVPLAERNLKTRIAIATLREVIDSKAAMAVWDDAVNAPTWDRPPVWIHGDLNPGNLLAREGKLCAVIDFGCLGVGDPACDVMVAWKFFAGASRNTFRAALGVDDATWARGRGWALSVSVIALPYYKDTNPILANSARHTIAQVLEEYRLE